MNKYMKARWLVVAVAATCTGSAGAFTFESGSITGNFDSSITLGMGIRAKSPGCDTVVGAVFQAPAQPSPVGSAPTGCLDGLSFYNDQGNLNYKKGDAFTTYLKGTHELLLKMPEDWKFFGRVNWLKDFTATHASGYINGLQAGVSNDSFPGEAGRDLRFKARLLDFWVSKEFDVGAQRARLRVGNQVISWGESLFLPGGINQTNALDIMRLSQPGAQLKEILLPAPMISAASGLGNGFNAEAYVQAQWNANYFPPVGSYWSSGTIGKGAEAFAPGVFAAPTPRNPKHSGQFGVALRYQPQDTQANFGVYAMRYHDKGPVVTYGNPAAGTGAFFSYLEDRTLYGVSTNFPLGNWAIGAELSYRPKDAVSLHSLAFNNVDGNFCLPGGKCYVDEKKYQFHLTGLLSMTPGDYGGILNFLGADTATLLAEAVVVRYPNLKDSYDGVPVAAGNWGWGFLTATDSGFPLAPGSAPSVGTKTSWGYNFDFSWTYDGKLIPGWQVTPEIYYFQAVKGRTPNGQALFMEGAKSANFIVTFTQNPANWAVGVNYAKFWGGSSVLDQPLRNRDFYGAYVTRNF